MPGDSMTIPGDSVNMNPQPDARYARFYKLTANDVFMLILSVP